MKRKRGAGQLVVYGKRKKQRTMTKYIKKVARSVTLRTLETKHNTITITTAFYGNGGLTSPGDVYYYNITRNFQQGDNDLQLEGSRVTLKNISIKGVCSSLTNVNAPQSVCVFRVTLVATDQQIGWGLNPGSGTNYGFQESCSQNGTLNWFNPRTMTVIKDRKITITPDLTAAGNKRVQFTMNKYYKKGLQLEFMKDPTGGTDQYLKRKNYYIVVCAWKPDANNGLALQMDSTLEVKIDYKDN